MVFTTPRTWFADEVVTASQLNTHLRDNMADLRAAKHGDFGRSAALTVPTSTWTSLVWDFADENSPAMWSASPYGERVAPPLAGVWLVTVMVRWEASAASGSRALRLQKNGVTLIDQARAPIENNTQFQQLASTLRLNGAGDYLNVHVWQSKGSDETLAVGVERRITVTWMGA